MILVAIGANLPSLAGAPPIETCRWAAQRLDQLPGLRLTGLSRWYRTAPVPASDQPDYVNGVAHLTGSMTPEAMLERLQALENAAGRVRSVPNAARVLDLDLLAIGDACRSSASLVLPHPRLQDRAFVLLPLCDVAAQWRHPVLGRTARELLDALTQDPAQRAQSRVGRYADHIVARS